MGVVQAAIMQQIHPHSSARLTISGIKLTSIRDIALIRRPSANTILQWHLIDRLINNNPRDIRLVGSIVLEGPTNDIGECELISGRTRLPTEHN